MSPLGTKDKVEIVLPESTEICSHEQRLDAGMELEFSWRDIATVREVLKQRRR